MFDLTGKRALVTGSSQGIGKEIAKLLAAHGAIVFVHGSGVSEKLKQAAAEVHEVSRAAIGPTYNAAGRTEDLAEGENGTRAEGSSAGAVHYVAADLTAPGAAQMLYAATGPVDILILNASMQIKKPWDAFTEEEFDHHIACNLKSSYFLIKQYAEDMKRNGWGRIVTLGSVNQYNNHPELCIYSMTKAGQYKLVQNIAPLLAPFGVTVNNITPGAIETPRNKAVLENTVQKSAIEHKIPMGYIGQPEDIAPAVLLMCAEEGRYITGADLIIDGGMHL